MPASESFSNVFYLGASDSDYTVQAGLNYTGGTYTVSDNGDGGDDNQTSTGSGIEAYFPALMGTYTGTLKATTDDGVIISYGGFDYLFTNTSYSTGATPSGINNSDTYVYCFLEDTQIDTPSGRVSIQDLKQGDLVLTQDGRAVTVRWSGYQVVTNGVGNKENHAPVRVSKGALGKDLPFKDLYLTGSHALLLEGKLVNASALCNGDTIDYVPMREMPDTFTYWHVETDAHEAIIANGLASETFVDAPDRRTFDNYFEYLDAYGVERVIPEMAVDRITDPAYLPASLKSHLNIDDTKTDWAQLVANSSSALKLK